MNEQVEEDHPLKCQYTYWCNDYDRSKKYDESLSKVASFDTIGKFWDIFTYLKYPDEINFHTDCLIFKTGIKPLWEDKANIAGGKWILRLKKGLTSPMWENLVVAMLGDELGDIDEICGVVVSVRGQEDILSVWNRNSKDEQAKKKIREQLFRVLELPTNTIVEYKGHANSIKDSSSFFNTVIAKDSISK